MARLRSFGAAVAPGLGFLVAVLAVLELATRSGMVNSVLVPPPSRVLGEMGAILSSGSVTQPLLQTLGTCFAGYILGCLAAVAVGLVMGASRRIYLLLEPVTELLRATPKPALLPPLMLLLGMGLAMKVTVIALAAFFPVLVSTVQGVRGVDPVMIDTARTFGYSRARILLRVMLPAVMPFVFTGMRISLGIALVVAVLSEMLAGTGGLGDQVVSMQRSFRMTQTFAWLGVIAVVGQLLTWLFMWAERRLLFWHARI